jgi:hypothetical protein
MLLVRVWKNKMERTLGWDTYKLKNMGSLNLIIISIF